MKGTEVNAIRFFKTSEEAGKFANEVNSPNWGWERDVKTGRIGNWYVEYFDESFAEK